ncbi:MAG TPA: tetratricopeptide repeat protein [Xanthobacteraceae bacterium]|nr:tetratricopeptide repeat protein [Xanthobacteraceae bacterium]
MESAAPRLDCAEPVPSAEDLRRAVTLHRNGELERAAQIYAQVLAGDPANPDAAHLLGVVRLQQGRPAEALGLIAVALRAKPRSPGILSNQGLVLEALGRPEEAIASYDLAIAHKPQDAEILENRGNALFRLGRFDDALAGYARALEHAPESADVRWNIGLIRLLRGELREGWEGYEWRWRRASFPDRDRTFAAARWNGEPLAGATILLHTEQGLGDTIQFVRYAPLMARQGARVVLEVQAPLRGLLADVPGVAQVLVRGETLPAVDVHCPLLSLPRVLATELHGIPASVPYLSAPPARIAQWRARLPETSRPRVGLVWTGNPWHADDRNRSLAFAQLAPLLSVAGIEFISLQKDVREPDRAVLASAANVRDLGHALADFADTAAVIASLDLVVCVDTAVAHLAGAMAKPVWILLPFVPDWRWLLDREDSPWYPTARLFRQPGIGDWDSVIARVREELTCWAAARIATDV